MEKMTSIRSTLCLMCAMVIGITVSTLADITSQTNKEVEQHFEKANELLKRMDYQGAITEYNKVISLSSDSKIAQDAQYWIGQAHFRSGKFDAAQSTFAKLIETNPTSAIVPVTRLMVERVEQARKVEEKRRAMDSAADKGFIIDPDTGVRYTKTAAFVGKNDVIEDTTYPTRQGCLGLSPNGKFLLYQDLVVPLDSSEPFELVDIPAAHCTWSPDGKNVAFNSEDGIYMVPVSPATARPTGPVRKLLDWRNRSKVSWSPDGEKLAFMSALNKDKEIYGGDIWTLSVKDGSLTQITNDRDSREGAPAWSPDGKTIAYGRKDRYKSHYSLCLISTEGGASRKIMEPGEMFFPFWSPDGKWILYELGGKIHLFGLNDEQELKIIPPSEVVGDFFSWSPDGKKLLFYRPSYGYKYDIRVVSASGGPPFDLGRQITLYPVHTWSADSKMIVAGGESEDGRYGLWVNPLSGGESVLIEMDVSVDGSPFPISVSPNVEKLAFGVDRDDGTEDLYLVPLSLLDARTTGSAIKVFDGLYRGSGTNVTTSWSPDGSKIAVIHRWDVWIASSNGDKPAQITETPQMELYPWTSKSAWSPDGKMLKYVIRNRGLYVVPASGGEAMKIMGAHSGYSAWSPDSKKIAFVSNGRISTVSVPGSATQVIANLEDIGLKEVFCLRWSPDGRHIACVGDAGPIFVIRTDVGKVTTLVANDSSSKYMLDWSPDGRWISYNSEGPVKIRPEGTMWEADFEEIVKKASR